jgi:hypothetical protein
MSPCCERRGPRKRGYPTTWRGCDGSSPPIPTGTAGIWGGRRSKRSRERRHGARGCRTGRSNRRAMRWNCTTSSSAASRLNRVPPPSKHPHRHAPPEPSREVRHSRPPLRSPGLAPIAGSPTRLRHRTPPSAGPASMLSVPPSARRGREVVHHAVVRRRHVSAQATARTQTSSANLSPIWSSAIARS